MPSIGESISFENLANQLKAGYVLYADIESLLQPISADNSTTQMSREKLHIPTGFSYALVKSTGELITYKVYRGEDAIEVFIQSCLEIAEQVLQIYSITVPLRMTRKDETLFQNATKCHICNKSFKTFNQSVKCRDHDHLTGTLLMRIYCM